MEFQNFEIRLEQYHGTGWPDATSISWLCTEYTVNLQINDYSFSLPLSKQLQLYSEEGLLESLSGAA